VKRETRARRLAAIAIAGCAFFLLIVIAFHFIQPELDPLKRFGSEYAAGHLGWLMNVGFVSFAAGLASLAIAFGHSLQPPARSRGAGVLLGLSSLGILGSGLFNSDLQGTQPVSVSMILHSLSGFLAFLTMIPAMILLSRRLHFAKPLRGIRPVLRYFPWLVLLLFLAMLFVFEPLHLVGLGQRLFLAAMFTWLLSAAHAVRSGTFALLDETRGAEEGSDAHEGEG
jgi:hypothetical protein